MAEPKAPAENTDSAQGFAFALTAYLLWGFLPFFMKAVAHIPAPERNFTWWSYRSPDFTRNDRGRRLDHMWCSPSLAPQAVAHRVHEPCRSWGRPSDHVPLVVELSF